MKQVTLNVADECVALGDTLKALIADVKAGKGAAAIAADVLPNVMGAIGGYSSLAADLKLADDQAYIGKCIAEALGMADAPAPVAAPAPAV